MKILERYLFKELVPQIVLVLFLLLGVDLLFYGMSEMKHLKEGVYTVQHVFYYVLLQVPQKFYTLFPWACLIGGLFAFGRLSKNSELIAMEVGKYSQRAILLTVLKIAFVLIIFAVTMGEYVAPKASILAQAIKMQALTGMPSSEVAGGLWTREGNSFVHIQHCLSEKEFAHITQYTFSEEDFSLKEILYADASEIDEHGKWHLKNVKGTRLHDFFVEKFEYPILIIKNFASPLALKLSRVKYLERLSLAALWETIVHRKENNLDNKAFSYAFFAKLAQPVVIVVMVLMGLPLVFGSLRNRSIGVKMLMGVGVGFSFYIFNTFWASVAQVIPWMPTYSAFLPSFLVLGLGLYALKR